MTYDGTPYSFHGQCDIILARSAMFGAGLGLDIHARTQMVDNWSLISNAAIRIGTDVLEVGNDNTHYFNGSQDVELPITMSGKYVVTKRITEQPVDAEADEAARADQQIVEYSIDLENGESITISNYKSMIAVRVNSYLSDVEGMLGRKQKSGMIGRDPETVIEDANELGMQWQVRDTEPKLFVDANRVPQYPESCMLPQVLSRRLRQSSAELQRAEEACAGVSDNTRQFCMDDVLMTGDLSVAIGYTTYTRGIVY